MSTELIKWFIAGALGYLLIFGLKIIFIYLLSLYFNESIRNYLEVNPKFIILEIGIFGMLFSAFGFVAEIFNQSNLIIHIFSILLIAWIPSYHFFISPVQYLFDKTTDALTKDHFRQVNEKYGYHIKIIRKNVINAYATGILPFTKTVLIGEPLMKKMNNKELLSIIYHEIGHLKFNHLKKLYLINLVIVTFSYFLFLGRELIFAPNMGIVFDALTVALTGAIMGFFIFYFPGKLQYKLELEADRFAATQVGKEVFIQALQKLDEISGGDVSKGGHTHPNLENRIKNLTEKTTIIPSMPKN